MFSSLTLR